jgi:hypothetical protein
MKTVAKEREEPPSGSSNPYAKRTLRVQTNDWRCYAYRVNLIVNVEPITGVVGWGTGAGQPKQNVALFTLECGVEEPVDPVLLVHRCVHASSGQIANLYRILL